MIAGLYRYRGRGLAVGLRNVVTVAAADAVVSTPTLPGPFLVVALKLNANLGGVHSAVVTVVPHALSQAAVANVRLTPQGAFLTPVGGAGARSGAIPIGQIQAGGRAMTYWPWYIWQGRAGALALWVRRHVDPNPAQWSAYASVWLLEEPEGIRIPRFPVPGPGWVGPRVEPRRPTREPVPFVPGPVRREIEAAIREQRPPVGVRPQQVQDYIWGVNFGLLE